MSFAFNETKVHLYPSHPSLMDVFSSPAQFNQKGPSITLNLAIDGSVLLYFLSLQAMKAWIFLFHNKVYSSVFFYYFSKYLKFLYIFQIRLFSNEALFRFVNFMCNVQNMILQQTNVANVKISHITCTTFFQTFQRKIWIFFRCLAD